MFLNSLAVSSEVNLSIKVGTVENDKFSVDVSKDGSDNFITALSYKYIAI